MRRAKLIKDLEEAQKWNNFISRQIKPLEVQSSLTKNNYKDHGLPF